MRAKPYVPVGRFDGGLIRSSVSEIGLAPRAGRLSSRQKRGLSPIQSRQSRFFEGISIVESAVKKRMWAIAALSMCSLGVASVIWATPATLQAADHGVNRFSGVAAGVHPTYIEGRVVETIPGQWDLHVGIRWTCAMDHKGVERARGLIHLWSPTHADLRIDLPCTLNASVQPGQPVLQNLVVPWDEWSEVHQWLRTGTSQDVRSAFIVEWAMGAAAPDDTTPLVGYQSSPRQSSRGLQSGHVSMSPR
jgi:hypothetical protein